ncbi:hypothetical protein U713_00140 [Rhodobacter capsulatus YW2]|nr:hypothetical protein U713_00140 [Rhodobacter capsulatus YW2]
MPEEAKPVEEETTSAPKSSPRPPKKPAKPAVKPPEKTETAEAEDTPAEKPAEKAAEKPADKPAEKPAKPKSDKPAKPAKPASSKPAGADAVADALAEAMGAESDSGTDTGSGGLGIAKNGPPVTAGEKEALIVDVKACWNVGALSSEAMRTTVTVRVDMQENGKPVVSSIKMIEATGGSDAAARQAFEAARRAIVRCGSDGFPLPAEKFGWWQQIEIVFNPTKMRMK